jgi:hypothetical protein
LQSQNKTIAKLIVYKKDICLLKHFNLLNEACHCPAKGVKYLTDHKHGSLKDYEKSYFDFKVNLVEQIRDVRRCE